MVRSTSIFLLVIMFLTFLCPFGAAAATPQYHTIDFLKSPTYTFYALNNNQTFLSKEYSPMATLAGYQAYSVHWYFDPGTPLRSITFSIIAAEQPALVFFSPTADGSVFYSTTYLNSLSISDSLNIYYYEISDPPAFSGDCFLNVRFYNRYNGQLGINSFIGFVDNIYSLDSANYFAYLIYNYDVSGGYSDGFMTYTYDQGYSVNPNFFYLGGQEWWGELPGPNTESPVRFDVVLNISLASFSSIDSIEIFFRTSGELVGDPDVFLRDSNGIYEAVLSYELIGGGLGYPIYATGNYALVDMYEYRIVIDLSGYELSSSSQLSFGVSSPVSVTHSIEELSEFYFNCISVTASIPTNENSAWYSGIVQWFTHLWEGMLSLLAEIQRFLAEFWEDFLYSIDALMLKLDDIIGVLAGTPEEEEEAEQFEQEANQANQNLGQLSGELDSVHRPDINDIDIAVDAYIPSDGVTALTAPFQVVFSNSYVYSILVVGFILALVSYVLFGKR